jgi:hypothetical protein
MTIPNAPDDHSSWCAVGRIKVGWHVLAGERWLRIDDVQEQHNTIVLVSGDISVQVYDGEFLWTRTPMQQFYAVSAALPSINNVELDGPMGNPFCGSSPTPIPELASPNPGWRRK